MDSDYFQQRVRMVDGQLRTTDVTMTALLEVMGAVPRERFVDEARIDLAYVDEDILLRTDAETEKRYLMQASPFARLVQLAEVGPDDAVLDIGCASGYSAAVLSRLAKSVVAIESDATLVARAKKTLADLGYENIVIAHAPLFEGSAANGPYDVIFVGGSVGLVPPMLFSQLKEGGRLVVVEGQGNAGRAKRYLRQNGITTGRHAFNASIKPLPGFEPAYTFRF